MQNLAQYAEEREADIERMCNSNHQEFLTSVNQLQKVREGTVNLTSEILKLNQSIQASTEKLADQKQALVDSRGVRQNIDEATQALKDCLEVLRVANNVHELLGRKNHYGALRALDELQNVHLKEVTQYKLADMIQTSAVMSDLNTWLYRIRETSQFLGEVAFYHTELRRTRQKERMEANPYLKNFKLNSAIEMVFDESEEFDVLDNEELQVDFTPLFECLHIHEALGQSEKFKAEYAATRRRQKELLLPAAISLVEETDSSLSSLLEGVAGFAIIERATMRRAHNLRSPLDVGSLSSVQFSC
jgi:NADH:ubiquinone oxidoreductase subunit C